MSLPTLPYSDGRMKRAMLEFGGVDYTPGAEAGQWEESENISCREYPADVPADAWYAEPLEWAVSAGLIAGFDDGTFRPDAPLTRAQLVSILYRYHAWSGKN